MDFVRLCRSIITIFIFISVVPSILADSPPPYRSFKVASSDGKYKAEVTSKNGIQDGFMLTVSDSLGTKLWDADFDYNGYPGGIYIANDGQSVVRINQWNSQYYGAILFYRNGQMLKKWLEEDIPFDRSKIQKTVSHHFWTMTPAILDEMGYGEIFRKKEDGYIERVYNKVRLHFIDEDSQSFYLTTIDGQRHKFDLSTGALFTTHSSWLEEKIREWTSVK